MFQINKCCWLYDMKLFGWGGGCVPVKLGPTAAWGAPPSQALSCARAKQERWVAEEKTWDSEGESQFKCLPLLVGWETACDGNMAESICKKLFSQIACCM